MKKLTMLRQVFMWGLRGNICSYDSEKYFVNGKVMTSVTGNKTEFEEGQNGKHMHT
jgi:hypothetical protein